MAEFVQDPRSSDRVNEIMRQAYDYLENTPSDRTQVGKALKKRTKAVKRNPIKCGKNSANRG